jgi:hypothetical protein
MLLYTAAKDGNGALFQELLQLFKKAGWQPLFGSLVGPMIRSGRPRRCAAHWHPADVPVCPAPAASEAPTHTQPWQTLSIMSWARV